MTEESRQLRGHLYDLVKLCCGRVFQSTTVRFANYRTPHYKLGRWAAADPETTTQNLALSVWRVIMSPIDCVDDDTVEEIVAILRTRAGMVRLQRKIHERLPEIIKGMDVTRSMRGLGPHPTEWSDYMDCEPTYGGGLFGEGQAVTYLIDGIPLTRGA